MCQAWKTPVVIGLKIPFAECEILCKHRCLGIIKKFSLKWGKRKIQWNNLKCFSWDTASHMEGILKKIKSILVKGETRWKSLGRSDQPPIREAPGWLSSRGPGWRSLQDRLSTQWEGHIQPRRAGTAATQCHRGQHGPGSAQALGGGGEGSKPLVGGCSDEKALCGEVPSPVLPCPVAAVVEDTLLEEWRELAHGVFGQRQPHLLDVQRGRGRLEHHAEKVPEVPLGRDKRQRHGQDTGREEAAGRNAQKQRPSWRGGAATASRNSAGTLLCCLPHIGPTWGAATASSMRVTPLGSDAQDMLSADKPGERWAAGAGGGVCFPAQCW